MSMVKKGVAAHSDMGIVGATTDEEHNAIICENCSRIIISAKKNEKKKCPYCHQDKSKK